MSLFHRRHPRYKKIGNSGEGRFHNPYLRRRSRASRLIHIVWLALGAVLLALAVYIVVFSPAFSILEVSINGASPAVADKIREVARDYLQGTRWLLIPGKNTIFVQPEALAEKLRKSLTVEALSVERAGPHSLRVVVSEMKPLYVIIVGRSTFLADKRGVTISQIEAPTAEKLAAVMITDYLSATSTPPAPASGTLRLAPNLPSQKATDTPRLPVVIIGQIMDQAAGTQIIRSETAAALEATKSTLEDYGIGLESAALAASESWELTARTSEGWQVYLDAGNDLKTQIDSLKTLLKSALRKRDGLQYVDLRYGTRVFYK